jgi:hypothetical protein
MAAPPLGPSAGGLQQEAPVILFGTNPGQGNLAAVRAECQWEASTAAVSMQAVQCNLLLPGHCS